MSRGKFIGVVMAFMVFVVGVLTLVQQVGSFTAHIAKGVVGKGEVHSAQESQPTSIDNANFTYLVPGKDPAWTFDDKQTAFDQGKGLVKYVVTMNNAKVDVTITQQQLPDQLKPRDSAAFNSFISQAKPTRSQQAGAGKIYFLEALKNGAPANGSDTVIYATDSILMFGRSDGVLGYEAWSTMLATLKPVSK